jgi:ATP-binding cassette subfamily B protein
MMLSVQYILGQLNGPIDQLIGFVNAAQDARLSLQRLAEIHSEHDEEVHPDGQIQTVPPQPDIDFRQVSFSYPGAGGPVLSGIDLHIAGGKLTAIVGASGSGKTTLLKLLLKFYSPDAGRIMVGNSPLAVIGQEAWRASVGAVLQDSFLFHDTLERNIAVGAERSDYNRIQHALEVANLHDFVAELPLGLRTRIGAQGTGLSQGQKQRILIARAVYKDPQVIFFDEATNALDAHNERVILENLQNWFVGRTVIVVAHRLSTVRDADQIVVLEGGKIVETGNHAQLSQQRGPYFALVKNQLELGV